MKDAKILADELEAKQIQLELQNEELKRIAQESDELKNRYYELYDFAPVGYAKTDDKGIILEINVTGAMLLGTDRSHIRKMPLITFIAVSQRAEFRNFLHQMQVTESRVHSELKLRDRKNDEKYVRLEGSVNKDEHPRSFMIAIIDITERKKAEEKLQNAYREIEQRVEERTAELKVANNMLKDEIVQRKQIEEELEKAKAQAELYVDLMGHDINNMNMIVMNYLELAKEMMPADSAQKEFLDNPINVLERSTQLISNVRKLQKLQNGVLQLESVDVCKVIADVQREFRATPRKAITVNMNGCERCLARANDLLRDVFVNLVGNAIKHTGDQAEINIDLDAVNDNGDRYCRVIVEDNGPGIPDDLKGMIFNRLIKGTNTAKGMGLGLFLVKSLVENYHGGVGRGQSAGRPHEGCTVRSHAACS
jgi:PAS domain S-box-containing protein